MAFRVQLLRRGNIGATRTHAQRPLGGEHGEDGEHCTLTGVGTLTPQALPGLLAC